MIIQSLLNNSLASPSTLGISSASALGANIAIITLARFGIEAGSMMTAGFAFIASVLCMLLVLAISSLRRADKTTVILAGVALNSLFSAITIIIQYFADETKLAAAVAWTFGDLGRINFHEEDADIVRVDPQFQTRPCHQAAHVQGHGGQRDRKSVV